MAKTRDPRSIPLRTTTISRTLGFKSNLLKDHSWVTASLPKFSILARHSSPLAACARREAAIPVGGLKGRPGMSSSKGFALGDEVREAPPFQWIQGLPREKLGRKMTQLRQIRQWKFSVPENQTQHFVQGCIWKKHKPFGCLGCTRRIERRCFHRKQPCLWNHMLLDRQEFNIWVTRALRREFKTLLYTLICILFETSSNSKT